MPASENAAKNNFITVSAAPHAAIEAYIALLKLKNYSGAANMNCVKNQTNFVPLM